MRDGHRNRQTDIGRQTDNQTDRLADKVKSRWAIQHDLRESTLPKSVQKNVHEEVIIISWYISPCKENLQKKKKLKKKYQN